MILNSIISMMGGGVVLGPKTLAYSTVVNSRGGSLTTNELIYLTTFESSVGSDLDEFDRLWIHGLSNDVAARTSFVNPSTTAITAVNSPTFTAGKGYTGNGATAYLNHNVTEASLVKYTQNSNSFFLYCNSNISEAVNEYGIFNPITTSITSAFVNSTTFAYLGNNLSTGTLVQTSNVNSIGLFHCKRTGTLLQNYKNATLWHSYTAASTALQADNIYSLGRNNTNLGPQLFSTKQHCLIGYGSGAISTVNFNNAVQTLGNSLGWFSYTTNFKSVVLSRGGSLTTAEEAYLRTFETSVGSDLAKFDRLYIHGLSNSIAAKTSFVNPDSAIITEVNAPTFTANRGYQGNGATSYLNTNFTPSTQAVNSNQNSSSIFVYSRTNIAANNIDIGAIDGSNKSFIYTRHGNGNAFYPLNVSVFVGSPSTPTANSLGLYCANLSSTTLSLNKNGVQIVSSTITPVAVPSIPFYLLGANNSGTTIEYSARQISLSGFGSGVINQANFYNAVQTLGTSIGWAV